MKRWIVGITGLLLVGLATGAAGQASRMTAAQARLLYAAGGFPISADGKAPTNRCGTPANPRITFVDMNGDGRKEALFIDSGGCYRPDGRWYAIATQHADGRWRRILEGPGTTAAAGTMANGWFVLTATSAGRTTRLQYDGTAYGEARPVSAAAASPPAVPAQGAGRDAAIFRAAGFMQTRDGWESGNCEAPHEASYSPGAIGAVKDLNGDGRPEAIVTEGGGLCYGMTGEAFWLVSQQADGTWKRITNEIGIPEFLATKGVGGWPDMSVGGPGFCFPVMRWNGKAYVNHRLEYEGKPCKR